MCTGFKGFKTKVFEVKWEAITSPFFYFSDSYESKVGVARAPYGEVTTAPRIVDFWGKPKSPVWKYFGFEATADGEILDRNRTVCRVCHRVTKFGNAVVNLILHLNTKHPEIQAMNGDSFPNGGSNNPSQADFFHTGESEALMMPYGIMPANMCGLTNPFGLVNSILPNVAQLVVNDLLPLSTVSGPGFQTFVASLLPQVAMPSLDEIKQYLQQQKTTLVSSVKKDISNKTVSAISFEVWQSGHECVMLSIYAHLVDKKFNISTLVLETKQLREDYTAQQINESIADVLKLWDIPDNIFIKYLVVDKQDLPVDPDTNCDNDFMPIACFNDVIQSAIANAYQSSAICPVVDKSYDIMSHFQSSDSALAILKDRLQRFNIDFPKNKNLAFEFVAEHQSVIQDILMSDSDAEELTLKDDQLALMTEFLKVIKPLKTAITALEEENASTVSMILPVLNKLIKSHLVAKDSDSKILTQLKSEISNTLCNSYKSPNVRNRLLVASALDARFMLLRFISDEERDQIYQQVESAAIKIAEQNKAKIPDLPNTSNEVGKATFIKEEIVENCVDLTDPPPAKRPRSTCSSASAASGRTAGESSISLLFEDEIQEVSSIKAPEAMAKKELQRYLTEDPISVNQDPLEWWKNHAINYPLLSELSKYYLCAPASIQQFKPQQDQLRVNRSLLEPQMTETVLFMHHNIANELCDSLFM